MSKELEIYKCKVCGNIVELFINGGGPLECCGQPMQLMSENSVDAAQEKHVPVISKENDGIKVKVGSVPHPMEEAHYIQWIELIDGNRIIRKMLKPGEAPEATFCCTPGSKNKIIVREYCNLHGQWKAEG
ncbi:MAG: desulfoferrodoxin [Desulfuromonadales bacterium]|nr:desulfoferrodoxin [Desulfuromonadales bacterium]